MADFASGLARRILVYLSGYGIHWFWQNNFVNFATVICRRNAVIRGEKIRQDIKNLLKICTNPPIMSCENAVQLAKVNTNYKAAFTSHRFDYHNVYDHAGMRSPCYRTDSDC